MPLSSIPHIEAYEASLIDNLAELSPPARVRSEKITVAGHLATGIATLLGPLIEARRGSGTKPNTWGQARRSPPHAHKKLPPAGS